MLVDGQRVSATEKFARVEYARVEADERGYRIAEQLLMFDVHREGYSESRALNAELRHGKSEGFHVASIPVGFRVFTVQNPDGVSWDVYLGDEAGEFIGSVVGMGASVVADAVRLLWEAYTDSSQLFSKF